MAIGPSRSRVRLYWSSAQLPIPEDAFDPNRFEWVEHAASADFVISTNPPVPAVPRLTDFEPSATLTAREKEILEYLADGWSNEEISDRLGITAHTVKFHLSGLYQKLGVGRRTEAVREALKLGYLRL